MAQVTCHTEGCGNAGMGITLPLTWVDDDGETQTIDAVSCGSCGNEITDITNDERVSA